MRKTRAQALLLSAAMLGAVALWMGVGTPAPERTLAAEPKSATDATTWSSLLTDEQFTALVKHASEDIQKSTRSTATFLRGYRKLERSGALVAMLGNIGTMKFKGERAKKAAALRAAGLELADAAKKKSYSQAKAAAETVASYPDIKPADDAAPAKWTDVIAQENIMKNVSSIDSAARRASRRTGAEFDDDAEEMANESTLLACLAVVAREQKKANDWNAWCDDFREEAVALAGQFSAKNAAGAKKAYLAMQQTCTNCHEVYRKEE